jgi:catechol 2,3-dioxygenase-like lactoylglutathione lyase family enzyme
VEIKLDQVNVVVGDMEAMAGFYGTLGLEFDTRDPVWARHHRNTMGQDGFDFDLDSQAFAPVWNQGWPGGPGIVLSFRIAERDDVDALYEQLTAAGHPGQQPPYDAFWGSRFAVVTDPDGNAVGLMSPIDPERRQPPPTPPS